MTPEDIAVHIDSMRGRFNELEKRLASPDIYSKPAECKLLSRERQHLAGLLESYSAWCKIRNDLEENRKLLHEHP